ncbi:methionine synthase [Peribacillus alkalitolerans]|uniref:methionine synthase n=1 Tax=Peribacillus alkalitolerans TaxID=1550385 RepID=UPI0013D556A0|nr:methionine synthase [Peribacillus alkalitolerans]
MQVSLLEDQLSKKILILDGAMGTMIQQANLSEADFGGEALEGCNEYLTITRPDIISDIHEQYLLAGADIIETNTFGSTSVVLEEYGLEKQAFQLNVDAAKLARAVATQYSTSEWPRFVAGAIGPTTKTLSLTGGISFDELTLSYKEQACGLLEGGVDLFLVETCQDMLNVKAAFIGIEEAFLEYERKVPIIISGTIEPMGTTLAGQSIEAFYISCQHMNPLAIGLNCATGPEFMAEHIRSLAEISSAAISCYPNAGLPDEEGNYQETAKSLAKKIKQFADQGWINIVGGCCGTTPTHIKAISEAMAQVKPRKLSKQIKTNIHMVSGIEPLQYDDSMRPLLVGERTNVIGSRKFKQLITAGNFNEAAEIARHQVKKGAHVIDICLADPDGDEDGSMEQFITEVVKKVKVPIVIDSTDEKVMETALKKTQGKCIINSVNLEDGEEKFHKVAGLVKKYGGALVVGTIDEKGMAVTAEEKLGIATRSYRILVEEYGFSPTDIIFDTLVFPVGTGDEQYTDSAKETVEGIRLIKTAFPSSLIILGISNVSFGLPPRGREILNAVFLYHCVKAGLDYAIVNTEKLERFASVPPDEIRLSEALLFENSEPNLQAFVAHFRDKKETKQVSQEKLPVEERLANYIIEGTKIGLVEDLDELLAKQVTPLDIINGPLMKGMAEVGRLFNDNKLIVAEVLQSAESMKAAVAHLEPLMTNDKASLHKGKMLLATVKGDVHDIGKNLVEIILSNNGYEIVDLGIKVAPSTLIEAVKKHQPTAIGLSGLLVKSAQQMVITAMDLAQESIQLPIVVGGAALSRKFTTGKIAPAYDGEVHYAKDAMDGLRIMNEIHSSTRNSLTIKKQPSVIEKIEWVRPSENHLVKKSSLPDHEVKRPLHLERRLFKDIALEEVIPYINRQMLYGHHLGLKGKVEQLLLEGDPKAQSIHLLIEELLHFLKQYQPFAIKAVYRFFPVQSEGNQLHVYPTDQKDLPLQTFDFPRQQSDPFLCLSDYVKSIESNQIDYAGFFVVSAGSGIRQKAEEWKRNGEYLKSHAIQALALEIAEGTAEYIHQRMREVAGISDDPNMTMKERFAAKYIGQRFSFGYPACPNLDDQEKLFELIQPQDLGITLTDGCMMEPEASVSAIVFSHPNARYFNVER